ncbi:MAG: DUF2304 domain-containing protein [Patescibacteria group bacterium]
MSTIQIVILLFVLLMWWRLYSKFKSGELVIREFVEWFLFWLVVAALTLVPDTASYLASLVGVGRGVDLIVYLALLLIFYLLFRVFMRLEKNNRQLTKVVRSLALKDREEKK